MGPRLKMYSIYSLLKMMGIFPFNQPGGIFFSPFPCQFVTGTGKGVKGTGTVTGVRSIFLRSRVEVEPFKAEALLRIHGKVPPAWFL